MLQIYPFSVLSMKHVISGYIVLKYSPFEPMCEILLKYDSKVFAALLYIKISSF